MHLRSGLTRSHDLSWGTKGSDTVQAVDLGAIQGVGRHVQVELVSAQQDIDIAYQDALDNIRLKRGRVDADELPPKRDATEQEQKDSYVSFAVSTPDQAYLPGKFPYKCKLTSCLLGVVLMFQLLLFWSLSNAVLASVILSGGGSSEAFSAGGQDNRTAVYMLVILSQFIRLF